MVMPDVVGQNYVDVHNELSRLRLKVKIESKRYPDRNDGEILYQSIYPGKTISSGSKVYLTVNVGTDRITIPDLKGQQLVSAKALLESVPSGDTYVNIELGGITFVPAKEGQAPETVIDQIPEAGKITTTKEKIFLLVTEPAEKDKKESSLNLEGFPFPIVAYSLDSSKKKFKISEIKETKNKKEDGIVFKAEKQNDMYDLKVYFYKFPGKPFQGYERVVLKPSNSGTYIGKITSLTKESKEKIIFSNLSLAGGEEFPYLIYRSGDIKFDLIAENGNVDESYKFKTDYLR
ncbi:MAG: PASTA domain-containing protein [Leptospiraceae bacterium]|nr:PASTA domain-containing protein [Leptospiraceae bacterium]